MSFSFPATVVDSGFDRSVMRCGSSNDQWKAEVTTMTTKDEFLTRFKAQLAEWESELEGLQSKAGDVADDIKASYHEQIAELRGRWEEGQQRFEQLTDSADDVWDEFKQEAEEKWAALESGVKESIDRFKSYWA
jgi:ElaB/YqjD/DUF883 family membrane-anchored ribosome-binding protein